MMPRICLFDIHPLKMIGITLFDRKIKKQYFIMAGLIEVKRKNNRFLDIRVLLVYLECIGKIFRMKHEDAKKKN